MSVEEIEQKEKAKTKEPMVMIGMEIDENPVSATSASAQFPLQKPRAGHTYRKDVKVSKGMSLEEIEQKEKAKTKKPMVMIPMEIDDNPVSTTSASAQFPLQKPIAGHTYRKEFKELRKWARRLLNVAAILLIVWYFFKWLPEHH
ncbi:unnamed protein product [Caenorhabditis brenneri]